MAGEILLFPFIGVFILLAIVIGVLALIFWIWAIIDCVKRDFRNENEKVAWILIIVLANWIGALVYFFVVTLANPKGVAKKK